MEIKSEYGIVITTSAEKEEARRIAQALLNARLAACIQIVPIESHYRWEEKLEESTEYRLEIKTRSSHFGAIEALINDLHSYEVPEILLMPIVDGTDSYLRWVDQELQELR